MLNPLSSMMINFFCESAVSGLIPAIRSNHEHALKQGEGHEHDENERI
jgi:hypothetical protein